MNELTFPVEHGAVIQFARAVGDPVPSLDIRDSAGIVAPLTFVTTSLVWQPDVPQRPHPGRPWHGSGAQPTGAKVANGPQMRSLHAEQSFDFHRPVHVGDILTVTRRQGEAREKHGRSGRVVYEPTIDEYRNQHGELVVTATATTARIYPPDVAR